MANRLWGFSGWAPAAVCFTMNLGGAHSPTLRCGPPKRLHNHSTSLSGQAVLTWAGNASKRSCGEDRSLLLLHSAATL